MAGNDPQKMKRKRGNEEVGFASMPSSTAHAPGPAPGMIVPINYLSNPGNLRLISGDPHAFQEILGLIDQYNGVLHRNESLAGNLGAKLVGSLILKSIEKLFEGPIKVVSQPLSIPAITWLDLIEAARHSPRAFSLMTDTRTGHRFCHVHVKDADVQISEDDYRLILSGGPERMLPSQPLAEDEFAELATIDIMEQRLLQVISVADDVAAKARIQKRNLQSRRAAIRSRQAANGSQGPFQPTNSNGINIVDQAIHQDLMRQFNMINHEQHHLHDRRGPTTHSARRESSELSTSGRFQPSGFDDGTGGALRPAILAKIEKLGRGDLIYPPCDRCRRIVGLDCTKHNTACTGCTKKHAKCSWNKITDEEKASIEPLSDNSYAANQPMLNSPSSTFANDAHANLDPALSRRGSIPFSPDVQNTTKGTKLKSSVNRNGSLSYNLGMNSKYGANLDPALGGATSVSMSGGTSAENHFPGAQGGDAEIMVHLTRMASAAVDDNGL